MNHGIHTNLAILGDTLGRWINPIVEREDLKESDFLLYDRAKT